MKSYIFRVEIEQDPDSGLWSAEIPALPGCAVDAGSPEEALEAVREAAQAYVAVLIEDGKPVPSLDDKVVTVVDGAAVAVSA